MTWRTEKTTVGQDLVWSGVESGIATSPHQGTANLQNVNLQTEMGEVMASYARVQQTQTPIATNSGTLVYNSSSRLVTSTPVQVGTWITVGSGITGLAAGNYYVINGTSGSNASPLQLSVKYSTSSSDIITGYTGGSALFSTMVNMGQAVQAATEQYTDSMNTTQYRYYVLDTNGFVWVYDTSTTFSSLTIPQWFLPNPVSPTGLVLTNATGIAVFNGYIHVFIGSKIYVQSTATLGQNNSGNYVYTGGASPGGDDGWDVFVGSSLNSLYNSTNSHFALVSQNNTLTYCDSAFVGTIESSSNSGSAAIVPIWSYGRYSTGTGGTTITVIDQIGGSNIISGSTVTFISQGTPPTGVNTTTLYYAINVTISGTATTFNVATTVGGSAITLGASGSTPQYFNTYKPSHPSGATTFIFSPQALSLPFNTISQSLCEIGSQIVVGTQSNIIYFWDEVSPLAGNFIPLPENNAKRMINVNNMAYIFAGSKGNIYITNGTTASAAISVPDYCAGVPGSPTTYIEPYFSWGGAEFIRGRVYFSIQDQTSTKAGNCGGIWSFVPTQNLFAGQDVGLALRQEAQNSYGTYNGVANVILNCQNQNANGPQYWSAWTSSISSPNYGIDFSGTTVSTVGSIIETDLAPVGTLLNKTSYAQIEYKLATPLLSGESVVINYRLNSTDAWASCGTVVLETVNPLSGYFTADFQNAQWVQLQPILFASGSTSSFVRLTELRIR